MWQPNTIIKMFIILLIDVWCLINLECIFLCLTAEKHKKSSILKETYGSASLPPFEPSLLREPMNLPLRIDYKKKGGVIGERSSPKIEV